MIESTSKEERVLEVLVSTKAYAKEAMVELVKLDAPLSVVRELTYALDALLSAEIENEEHQKGLRQQKIDNEEQEATLDNAAYLRQVARQESLIAIQEAEARMEAGYQALKKENEKHLASFSYSDSGAKKQELLKRLGRIRYEEKGRAFSELSEDIGFGGFE